MELTITEALRIKNEVSNTIKNLNYQINRSSLGVTYEDGIPTTSEDEEKFNDVEYSLIKALEYSEELNNTISLFNKNNGVDALVRKMQNHKLLLTIYTNSLGKTKPNKQKRFENLGTTRQSIETNYVPSITSTDMKQKISTNKLLIREFQSKIELLNQSKIEVNFGYSDLEKLIS